MTSQEKLIFNLLVTAPKHFYYNEGHLTWVTQLWSLPFSLPMLFCNGFSTELFKFEANIIIGRERERNVDHNMST